MRYLIAIILILFIGCKPNQKTATIPTSLDTVKDISAPISQENRDKWFKKKRVKSINPSTPDTIVQPDWDVKDSGGNGDAGEEVEHGTVSIKYIPILRHSKKNIPPPQEIKKKHEYGNLVYNIPDSMKLRKTYVLTIRVNRDTADKTISVDIQPSKTVAIKTACKMEVKIVDPSPSDNKAFDIVENNAMQQRVDKDDFTEWVYNVTPLRRGKFKLNLVVSIVEDAGTKQVVYFRDITVSAETVVVVETFWSKYWQWCIGTLLLPLIIWLYNKKR